MNQQNKNCQNCKKDFIIESGDFDFYEKMKVPAPTFCPDCRYQRRMSWRNGWHLFKKIEQRSGEKIFSLFPEESPVEIYEKEYWNSDSWDAMTHGREYDFSKPFFEQFKSLMHAVPHPAHSIINLVDCLYCTNANNLKSCYLVKASSYSEDSAYLIWDKASKSCMDSHMTDGCELGYGNVNTITSFKILFSVDCSDCSDIILSKDCVGCTNCFGCVGLKNKSYCFFNEQLTKEEYEKRLAQTNIASHKSLTEVQKKAYDFWKTFPHKYIHGRQNFAVSGDYILESKNAKKCYRVWKGEDIKYCQNLLGSSKDCHDYSNWGEGVELLYESLVCGLGNSRLRFCAQCYPNNMDLEYSVFCQKSSNLFACVGLKNKEYCIFNKQYTKEEYEQLVPKIKKHMDEMPYIDGGGKVYKYGEFFPSELSPFTYQVSEASEFFPLSETEVKNNGFTYYDIKTESHSPTLNAADIPDQISDVNDSIVNEIIGCEHAGTCKHECTKAFRIIGNEVKFCKRLGIPLPRLCPNCRHQERLVFRNGARFYKRKCTCGGEKSENRVYQNQTKHSHGVEKCPNEFETSYAPDRPEIVYCEQCYQSEVA